MKIKSTLSTTDRILLSTLLVMSALCFTACSPSASIVASWKEPSTAAYKDLFVTAFTHKVSIRSMLEQDLGDRLRSKDVKVTQSLEIFPANTKFVTEEERKAAVEKIQSLGFDAIITLSVVRVTDDVRYVPSSTQYTPMNYGIGGSYYGVMGVGYYGTFGGYYNYGYSTYTTPGYYVEDKAYFVESNMYDAKSSKLIWSVQSEILNPTDISSTADDVTWAIASKLKRDNLIYKQEKK